MRYVGSLSFPLLTSVFILLQNSQLFGEDEDAIDELDQAEKQGENGKTYIYIYILSSFSPEFLPFVFLLVLQVQEIEMLRKEALAFKAVRKALRTPSPNGSSDVAKNVFDKVSFPPFLTQSSPYLML